MNPERYAKDRDYASDQAGHGMTTNIFSRIFELRRNVNNIEDTVEDLKEFEREYDQGELSKGTATGGLSGVKRLMRSLDAIEYALPELREERWFSGFQSDVHHAYWRVEDGRFSGVLDLEPDSVEMFAGEVKSILSNIPESVNTNPVDQLHRYLERYGGEFYPYDAPDEYQNDVFEARDLFCIGYFSTGLIVLGRAVERALLQLGEERKIVSIDGFRDDTAWRSARFFERTEALYNIDDPEGSGKMLTKRQYHQIQQLIDYRNQVAHDNYKRISKGTASRMMGHSLDLLSELEEKRGKLQKLENNQINELENASVPL